MGFSLRDKLTCQISRISNSGNAIANLHDGQHINLGQIPKIEGEIPVVITDNSSYLAGNIRPDAIDSPLSLVPTEESHRIIPVNENVEEDIPNITELNLGVTKFFIEEPIPVDSLVTLAFEDMSKAVTQATILSIEDPPQTSTNSEGSTGDRKTMADPQSSVEATPEDGAEIQELVGRLNEFSSDGSSSAAPGGETREKYNCKCCGTRVDPGTHKCDLCQKSGCDAFNKRCQFS